jgi:hypothetical protein
LLVKQKPQASLRLKTAGVMATELWNEGDPLSSSLEGPGARFLRRHLLELPIHQDVDERQIRYIAHQVAEARIALEQTRVRTPRRSTGPRRTKSAQEPIAS